MQKKRVVAIILTLILIISTCPVFAATSNYDLRDYINIKIKNQLDTGACWLITMSTIFETNMSLKNGINLEVSPRHMDYATSQSFKNGEYNELGFSKKVNSGGTAELALAYLTNGSGPVEEKEMPFSNVFENIDINEIKNKKINYQVDKWISFPTIAKDASVTYKNEEGHVYTTAQVTEIRNQIKEHIMQNGAVYSGINATIGFSKYYNPTTHALNCNDYTLTTDHAIAIIGWDDNYPKENFKSTCRPKQNGAYLIQNSWGNDPRLDNGTFYVSYEDAIIELAAYGIVDVKEKNYSKIYQYDELGRNQYFQVSGATVAYGANVYERDSSQKETLSQVAISTYMTVDCEVYINPISGDFNEKNLVKVTEGRIVPGYNKLYLDKAITLKGEKFAVVVKYKKADTLLGLTTISLEQMVSSTNPYQNLSSRPGESYIGSSLTHMRDLYEVAPDTNLCIKAFSNIIGDGDINGDGKITALDLSILKLHMVGLRELENKDLADVNTDNKITAIDLAMLQKILTNNLSNTRW